MILAARSDEMPTIAEVLAVVRVLMLRPRSIELRPRGALPQIQQKAKILPANLWMPRLLGSLRAKRVT